MEKKEVLAWLTCLLLLVMFVLVMGRVLKAEKQLTGTQVCATHIVDPVLCTLSHGNSTAPWKAKVQMRESDERAEGELIAFRAAIGQAYADVRKGSSGFPEHDWDILQVWVVGERNESVPENSWVTVDAMYQLPSGSTTLCRSSAIACT